MTERPSPKEDIDLTREEWDHVVKLLLAEAKRLVPNDAIRGLGAGPKDLVQETMRRLLDPNTSVKWNGSTFGKPTVPKVAGFLRKVLRRHFLDLLRKGEYRFARTPLPDPGEVDESESGGRGSSYSQPSPTRQLGARIYLEELYTRTRALAMERDDADVVIYLDLQMDGGGPYSNAETARKLGVTAAEVVNICKRLDRLTDRVRGPVGRP